MIARNPLVSKGLDPVNWGRWTLTIAYLLAGLLAQGAHVHDRGASQSFLEDEGNCNESRLHIADHPVADPGESPTVCPSCQHRSQAQLWELPQPPAPGPSLRIPLETARTSTLPGSPLRTRCRAPPLA